jgi:hypothetical protein
VTRARPARSLGLGAVAALLALELGACATAGNTPQQDLAYTRWRACAGPSTLVEIDRVEPGGRIWFSYFLESERQAIVACLDRAAQAGPSLPQPVGVYRAKGGA